MKDEKLKKVRMWTTVICIAAAVSIILRHYFFVMVVSGVSMEPTYHYPYLFVFLKIFWA